MTKETILPSHYDDNAPLVLDASAIINLLGSGLAGEILSFLRTTVLAERTAFREVTRHPVPGLDHVSALRDLSSSGLLLVQEMDDESRLIFRTLTADDLTGGLDDGEAATIALAVEHSSTAIPVIDERKASNLFTRRWSGRAIVSTAAVLSDPRITRQLSRARLADAVFSALVHARMRVPTQARGWVHDLIGEDRVALCPSLGRGVRHDTASRGSAAVR